jgi:hypothetical protein
MPELVRLARLIRCNSADPAHNFAHRLRIGFAVAVLILVVSLLR